MLFSDISGQYLDGSGKIRAVYYETNEIYLIVSPQPFFDNVAIIRTICINSDIDNIEKFMKDKKLSINYLISDENDKITGIAVNENVHSSKIISGVIPTDGNSIKRGMFKDSLCVRHEDISLVSYHRKEPSELEIYRKARKVSYILREMIGYLYSHNYENFTDDKIVVKTDRIYDISDFDDTLSFDNSFFDKNRNLIVHSEEMKRRLLYYLDIIKSTDLQTLISKKNEKYINISSFYKNTSDYSSEAHEIVLFQKEQIVLWKSNKIEKEIKNRINTTLFQKRKEPYFYRNKNIYNGRLLLIQNVVGGYLPRAVKVSVVWNEQKKNIGFDAPPMDPAELITMFKSRSIQKWSPYNYDAIYQADNEKDAANIFVYSHSYFAAILPI